MRSSLAVLLLLLSACSDATAPNVMTLTWDPDKITMTGERLDDGRIVCLRTLALRAQGGNAGDKIILNTITHVFYDMAGTYLATSSTPATDYVGTGTLNFDERRPFPRTLTAAVPTRLETTIQYFDSRMVIRTETMTLFCK